MQHFATEAETIFYKKPQPFTKWESPDVLSYALGATLYMPASMPTIVSLIRSQKYKELTSLVIDLEDAVGDAELVDCETKLIEDISELYALYQQKQLLLQELPLLLFEYVMLSNFKS